MPLLYVYEVQLVPNMQRKGLGAFLMTLLKLLAKKHQLEAIMLTVMNVGFALFVCMLMLHLFGPSQWYLVAVQLVTVHLVTYSADLMRLL